MNKRRQRVNTKPWIEGSVRLRVIFMGFNFYLIKTIVKWAKCFAHIVHLICPAEGFVSSNSIGQ